MELACLLFPLSRCRFSSRLLQLADDGIRLALTYLPSSLSEKKAEVKTKQMLVAPHSRFINSNQCDGFKRSAAESKYPGVSCRKHLNKKKRWGGARREKRERAVQSAFVVCDGASALPLRLVKKRSKAKRSKAKRSKGKRKA